MIQIEVKNNIQKWELANYYTDKTKWNEVTAILDCLHQDLISNFKEKVIYG